MKQIQWLNPLLNPQICGSQVERAKPREGIWAELIFKEEKIRSLCKECLNYLGSLYFAAAPLEGPRSFLALVLPEGVPNLIHCQPLICLSRRPLYSLCLNSRLLPSSHLRAAYTCTAVPHLLYLTHFQSFTRLILCHTVPSTPRQFVTPSLRLPWRFVETSVGELIRVL